MFKTIKNALKTPDVRKKLLYTVILIVVFRLGCYITVPGVNTLVLSEAMSSSNGITGFIDIISGGAFSRLSIFAMSIGPYITASIVVQLLSFVIPSLEKMIKEGGEEGKRRRNRYTKLLTIVLALVEAIGVY
ncbi:MAG: preprotein translocase subunit SecY, partial [Intestinibacter bartlettii]|nr:preprotein translocase subunit SecY [Intestinibacter bartlettii]